MTTDYVNPSSVTYEAFKEACETSESKTEVARKLGLKPHKTVGERLNELSYKFQVDLPIWDNRKSTRAAHRANTKWTPKNVFVYGKHWRGPSLRKWMIEAGVPYVCSVEDCPLHTLVEWCGKPITLQVDHIDGDNINNVLSNLRFLCANCHSQTETFGSRNAKNFTQCECGRRKGVATDGCPHGVDLAALRCGCGEAKDQKAKHCDECSRAFRMEQTLESYGERFPSVEVMIANIEAKGWSSYSKELGISDNGLRKVFRRLGVTVLPKYVAKRRRKSQEF